MKNKKKILLSAVLTIVLCLSLIAGTTFALFTSESKVNIAITSGKVNVVASLSDPTLYSANAYITTGDKAIKTVDTTADSADGQIYDGTYAGTYYYEEQTGTFLNHGTATVSGSTLTIDKMTPGDKVKTTLSVANNSNVVIQYRLNIVATDTSNQDLLAVLKVDYAGRLYTGLSSFTSAWTKVEAPAEEGAVITTKDISVIFPLDIDGTTYMDKTVSFDITVDAVQGNAKTSGDEEVETIVGTITNYAPAATTIASADDDYVQTPAEIEIVSTDIEATSTIPGDTVFFMDKPGTTDLIPLGEAEGDGSLARYISTTATSETSAVIDISYKYTDSDNKTTDVTGFSNIVTNVINVGIGLMNVTVTRTHNGTTTAMTEGFDPSTGEGFSYDASTGILTIKSKLYSDFTMEFIIPEAKIVKATNETTYYEHFVDAVKEIDNSDTLYLLNNIESDRCFLFSKDITATLNLNEFTLKVTGCVGSDDPATANAAGGRAIKVTAGQLTIENGTIDGRNYSDGEPVGNPSTSGPWSETRLGGAVRVSGGDVILKNLVMYNNDGWGNAVKLESDNTLTMTDCQVISQYGACIEIGTGTADITSCSFEQTDTPSPAYHATCIAVCSGGEINIDKDLTSADKTSANGGYALYVYSSGGTINVYDGNYVGTEEAIQVDVGENVKDSIINVFGGTFNGGYQVSTPGQLNICKGTYTVDPSAYVVEGYSASLNETSGKWEVEESPYIAINKTTGENYLDLNLALQEASAGDNVKLLKDVDLAEVEWTPVSGFAATFDGGNHTISNFTLDGTGEAHAFIEDVENGATIKNVKFANVAISGLTYAATVVWDGDGANNLTFSNIEVVSGTVSTTGYAAGLFFDVEGNNNTITNCINRATITSDFSASGIGAWMYFTGTSSVSNCVNYGDVTGGNRAGGIFGNASGMTITNSTNHGAVTSNGGMPAGGIVGVLGDVAITFDHCTNNGNVTNNGEDANNSEAGGILGHTPSSAATFNYCINTGNISSANCTAGGICGNALYGGTTANYCYNSGAITAAKDAGGITPKALFATGDYANNCLNAGTVTSSATAYQICNNKTSCYYYDGDTLKSASDNTDVENDTALDVLNGGTDASFFAISGGKIKPASLID